jgi:hypothetical protein
MAPHIEDSCHDQSNLTSDSVHHGQNSEPVTGLHYAKEELFSVRPVEDDNLTEKTGPSVVIGKQPSVTIKEEKLEDVKRDHSQGVAEVEPQGDGSDNDLDEVMLEKKKKKKKGSGKNRQEAPNGFEGNSPPPTICYAMLTLRYRVFRRYTHYSGGVR